jgi:hypothetical protein
MGKTLRYNQDHKVSSQMRKRAKEDALRARRARKKKERLEFWREYGKEV